VCILFRSESLSSLGEQILMRLAWFTDTLFDINGVARFVGAAARRLDERGRTVRIFTSARTRTDCGPLVSNLTPVIACPMPGYPALDLTLPPAGAMGRAIEKFRPDIVHISTPGPVGLVGRGIARRLRLPIVGVYHTDFPAYLSHLFDNESCGLLTASLMRRFYRPFARVLTRSPGYASALGALGIPPHRIHHLRPGIEAADFGPRRRDPGLWNTLGLCPATPKVLYVGRVSVEKNLPMLARIWIEYQRNPSAPRAELVVVGDGPYLAPMRRELAGLRAHFLGFRLGPELAALYASADLFVFPSTTDTLGQVVLEAQASGLPVLVSRQEAGGPAEIIDHPRSGLALAPDNPAAWARALIELLSDDPRRARMGAAAAERAGGFDLAESVERFWTLHEEALAEATDAAALGKTRGAGPPIRRPSPLGSA